MNVLIAKKATRWFEDNLTRREKVAEFLQQHKRGAFATMSSLGYYGNLGADLVFTLQQQKEQWKAQQRFLADGVKSLLFNFRMCHLTMTEIVVLLLVLYSGIFVDRSLSAEFVEILQRLMVPHIDPVNSWSTILWNWAAFCRTYTTSTLLCPEMKTVFLQAAQIILDRVSEGDVFENHQMDVSQFRPLLSARDVVLGPDTHLLCVGMLKPGVVARTVEEAYTLTLLTSFISGDVRHLSSLFLQVQLTLRVIQRVSDPRSEPPSTSLLQRDFSSIECKAIDHELLNTDTRADVFDYPNSFRVKTGLFVETRVAISLDDAPESHTICLPIVVFAYLFKSPKIVRDLQDLLVRKGVVGPVEEWFSRTVDEKMTDCLGSEIPLKWSRDDAIQALM